MAKSAKKVSITKIDKIMEEYFKPNIEVEWFGVNIQIKDTISLSETLAFVNDVVASCFQDDGTFMPEVMDFAIKSNVLTRYSNLSLPDNLEHRYDIIYRSDIIDLVCGYIDSKQLDSIVKAIDRKIDFMCNTSAAAIQKELSNLISAMDDVRQKSEDLFAGLSPEDISKLTNAVENEKVSEDKIVQAYFGQATAKKSKPKGV